LSSNIIIVGCGRVGSQLAITLSESGNNVCIIDRDAKAFSKLGQGFNGSSIEGVGFDESTLTRAGIEECDCLAAVTNLDNANLMIAEVASRLHSVPQVIARLSNPDHERTYEQLGIDYVCGTSLVAEEIFAKISSGIGFHIDTFGEYELLRFSLNLKDNDMESIRASQLEKAHDIRLITFARADGSGSSIPDEDSVLTHGDSVVACVRHELLPSFSRWIQS